MDPLVMLIVSLLSSLPIAKTYNTETSAQNQALQRQLTASDFAQNPDAFMARLGNMLGVGGNPSAAGGGVGGIQGMLQTLLKKFTPQLSQNLRNNVWQQTQGALAGSGLTQAPGIANSVMATALAPYELQEQQLGAGVSQNALNTGLQTEESNLQYPFNIGSGLAGEFPNTGAFL